MHGTGVAKITLLWLTWKSFDDFQTSLWSPPPEVSALHLDLERATVPGPR